MKTTIDTRFFIAHFLAQDEQTKKWTRAILMSFKNGSNIGIVPSIVILEFYKFMLETYGKTVADMRTNSIIDSEMQTICLDPSIGIEAAKLRCKYSELPTADAIIAATALVTKSENVLTDDKHINRIKETKTKWI